MKNNKPKRIIISRTDSIGDVVLTLPLCIELKKLFPFSEIVFLCKTYTSPVIAHFSPVDEIITLEYLDSLNVKDRNHTLKADMIIHVFPNKKVAKWAFQAKIPTRIGTSHRWFHLIYCNQRIAFTRKNSPLHEAQLNLHLLKPLGLNIIPDFSEILDVSSNFKEIQEDEPKEMKYIVIHPLSQGSAVEYPISKYVDLAQHLAHLGFHVLITGTSSEGERIGPAFNLIEGVENVCGKYSLTELIEVISKAYALVACSTGPLHIAGALNVKAIGLFSSRKPIHPGRWQPLGKHSKALVYDEACIKCASGAHCNCIELIPIEEISKAIVH